VSVSPKEKPLELTAVLIAPNRELARQFCLTLPQTRAFQVLADLKKYPTAETLEIRLRQFRPEVVLIDVSADVEAACGLIRFLVSLRPPIPVVGLDASSRPDTVMRVLRLGASEFLSAPFDPLVQKDAAAGIVRLRRTEPAAEAERGKIIAFTSAKPGSGASILACQAAFALQRLTRKRVLLADLDVAGGTVGFYTGQQQSGCFLDALEQAGQADPVTWASLTADCRGVAVLAAPSVPREMPFDPGRLRQALDQVRCFYDWAVLDLPAVFHRLSRLALAEADRTYLVCTTELVSLHLARKAVRLLGQIGVGRERFEVLVNQIGKREGMSGSEIEKVLECPVRTSLPDDQCGLHEAVTLGAPLKANSGLGQAIEHLACRLAEVEASEKRKANFVMDSGPVFAGT
jgi:pilus assembly protein CpaE